MPTIEESYCYPMNCTWKVFNEFPYDNIDVDLFAYSLYLRPNSRDYIEARLPNGTSLVRLTATDNCQEDNCTTDYIINAKEFHVNFVTGPPAVYSPPFNLTSGTFLLGFYGYVEQCDCSVPSIYFLNGLTLQTNFVYTLGYDAYCVPMDCSWKIINGKYGENSVTVMPSGISLRNTSEDYIEARNSNGKLLFRIDGKTRNLPSQYNIYDRTFNITFHSSSKVPLNPSLLPSWNLALQLGSQIEPTSAQTTTTTATTITTTTGMTTTTVMTTTTGALMTTTTGMNNTNGMSTTPENLTTTAPKSRSAKIGILSTFIAHVILISLFNFIY
uniref:CUB domain-containing protein n=1 Tax=Acrobeloides nanus TaxID=290746 RepID=A0A914CVI8_9BILA